MTRTHNLDRRWREARSLTDLGHVAADWLEGRVPGEHPNGYDEIDPETTDLVPVLVAANRAGFVTDSSQPGKSGPGFDGAHWEQRAAVDGFIADQGLLDRLTRAARSAGADTLIDDRRGVVVTTRDGELFTGFGARIPRSHMRLCWAEVGRGAYAELKRAHHVAIIARDYGTSGERLWPALATAIR